MKVAEELKKYDKYLKIKKLLNGKVCVYRQSPFSKQVEFKVKDFKNHYIGSGRSILLKIVSMDNQRSDISGSVVKNNMNIRRRQNESNRNMHSDVADIMLNDNIII